MSSGATLQMGDPIGTLGNTGQSTGPHLGLKGETAEGETCILTVLNISTIDE